MNLFKILLTFTIVNSRTQTLITDSELTTTDESFRKSLIIVSFLANQDRVKARDYRVAYGKNFCSSSFSVNWSMISKSKGSYFLLLLLLGMDIHPKPGPSSSDEAEETRCDTCGIEFGRTDTMKRHVQSKHKSKIQNECESCGKIFSRKDSLRRHLKKKRKCSPNKSNPKVPKITSLDGPGPSTPESPNSSVTNTDSQQQDQWDGYVTEDDNLKVELLRQMFRGRARVFEARFKTVIRDSLLALEQISSHVLKLVDKTLKEFTGLKLSLCLNVELHKPNEPTKIPEVHHFWCHQHSIFRHGDFDINVCFPKILSTLDKFMKEGSGWAITKIKKIDINIAAYEPLSGRCHSELPKQLQNKRAVINIQNNDEKCFLWCIIARLYPVPIHRNRVEQYWIHEAKMNCDNITFPMTIRQVPKFERQNNLSINIYGFENILHPLCISERSTPPERHVDLLLYDDHYFLISNLDRLLSHVRGGNRKKYFCHRCLFPQYTEDRLTEHLKLCVRNEPTRILPPKDKVLKFRNFKHMIRQPWTIYADFEAYTVPVQGESIRKMSIYQRHVACSYGMVKVVNCCGKQQNNPVEIYRDENPIKSFLSRIVEIAFEYNEALNNPEPLTMTDNDENEFANAEMCHICELPLQQDRVRDHCHICGNYRGAAHNNCNQLLCLQRDIVVVFHNLRRYDAHLIMQEIGGVCKSFGLQLDCIAKSFEDYVGFTLTPFYIKGVEFENHNSDDDDESNERPQAKRKRWHIRFVDSYMFLSSSLDQLVKSMDPTNFTMLRQEFADISLLTRKGVFPYDAMKDSSFFERTELPSRGEFFNNLNNQDISQEDYSHAQKVWTTFDMENMGDYHDTYLKCDVLSLADIMQNFREVCLEKYGLDPLHYWTLPSFSFDACYKITKVKLEALTDPNIYALVRSAIRGGLSVIMHRYAEANNPYLASFNPLDDVSFLMYLDVTNLYGSGMTFFNLPTDSFRELSKDEISKIDFLKVPENSEKGYILVVDLDYPEVLHEKHNDYPLAPEKVKIDDEQLSRYSRDLKLEIGTSVNVDKLIARLTNKREYTIDYRMLQLCCRLKMQLVKIHKVIEYNQSPWLGEFININTELRSAAKTKFEKDLFKLMSNSTYGKTLEDPFKYQEVKLVTEQRQYDKLVSSPRFKRFSIFSEDLVGISMKRKVTRLDKPIYIGFTVLEVSKILMYRFHYDHMVPKYGKNLKLCFTDTDSFLYHIKTKDIYRDMQENIDLYDTSDYPEDHFLYSNINHKKLGKMTDETQSTPISHFVGLRAKMYAYKVGGKEVKKAKGIKKQVVNEDIGFDDYYQSLFSHKVFSHSMNMIRTDKHQIYSITQSKKSLSPFDDKRYILDDGVSTLAYGHCRIKEIEKARQDDRRDSL